MYEKMINLNLEEILNEKTELCDIMGNEGTNKGCTKEQHNYTQLYHYLFGDLKDSEINLLEVGIGSINPNIPSNMGLNGVPGASLRGWKKYFNKATIYSGDIDQDILFNEDRIKTYYLDQTSEISVKLFHKEINTKYDIIIDDGLHTFTGRYNLLIHSLNELKEGGIYIIEDIEKHNLSEYNNNLLLNLKERFNLRYVKLLELPYDKNKYDNYLLILIK